MRSSPSEIMDVFKGRANVIAFNQESDEPRVLIEFGEGSEIVRVVIDGVPFANVVQQPVRPGGQVAQTPNP